MIIGVRYVNMLFIIMLTITDYLWRPIRKNPERLQRHKDTLILSRAHARAHTRTHAHTHTHTHTRAHTHTHTHTYMYKIVPVSLISSSCRCFPSRQLCSSADTRLLRLPSAHLKSLVNMLSFAKNHCCGTIYSVLLSDNDLH